VLLTALSIIIILQKNLSDSVLKEQRRKEEEAKRWEMKFRELQATIQRNESIILLLRQQLNEYQIREVS
jgi:uncharacterized protein YjaG (DUF416 family)